MLPFDFRESPYIETTLGDFASILMDTSTSCALELLKSCKIRTKAAKTNRNGRKVFDIGRKRGIECSFARRRNFRIEDLMSLIKIVIYALVFLLSLLFLGRFF